MMLERQREGVAKPKEAGKYKGRKPNPLAHRLEVIRLAENGINKSKIAKQLSLGEATVYRILAAKNRAAIKPQIPQTGFPFHCFPKPKICDKYSAPMIFPEELKKCILAIIFLY